MKRVTSFVILMGALLLAGCAAHAPATGVASAVSGPMSGAPAQIISARPQVWPQMDNTTRGYDLVVVEGKALFCRTEAIAGSRMMHRVCFTQTQLQARQEAARHFIETLERNQGAIPGGTQIQPIDGATKR